MQTLAESQAKFREGSNAAILNTFSQFGEQGIEARKEFESQMASAVFGGYDEWQTAVQPAVLKLNDLVGERQSQKGLNWTQLSPEQRALSNKISRWVEDYGLL